MVLTNPGSFGLLTRSARYRSATLNFDRTTKRYLELTTNGAPVLQNEALPPSMATATPLTSSVSEKSLELSNKEVIGADEAIDDMMVERDDEIRPPRAVQLAYLRPLKRKPTHRIPSCNLQLRSYSARNLEFFTTFALRAAYFLKLPAVGPVPLPRQVERWTVPRGHFIHKKSQENFERITMRRLIQIQDGHPETIQMWLAYLRKRQYYGVGMKANVWTFDKLGCGKEMDVQAENGQSLDQRWTSEFSQDMTPEVQAKVDEWIAAHAPGVKADLSSKEDSTAATQSTNDPAEELLSSSEVSEQKLVEAEKEHREAIEVPIDQMSKARAKKVLSATQKVERVLAQIELEAAEAERLAKRPSSAGSIAAKESTSKTMRGKTAKSTKLAGKAKASTTSVNSVNAAPAKGDVEPPVPSNTDTTKDNSTPEEADPSKEPTTEKAREAEAEDAEQPMGDLPKTPS